VRLKKKPVSGAESLSLSKDHKANEACAPLLRLPRGDQPRPVFFRTKPRRICEREQRGRRQGVKLNGRLSPGSVRARYCPFVEGWLAPACCRCL